MIAHRLSTLNDCDKVFNINGGKIIEELSGNDLKNKIIYEKL